MRVNNAVGSFGLRRVNNAVSSSIGLLTRIGDLTS
jgi:hypothetical protein